MQHSEGHERIKRKHTQQDAQMDMYLQVCSNSRSRCILYFCSITGLPRRRWNIFLVLIVIFICKQQRTSTSALRYSFSCMKKTVMLFPLLEGLIDETKPSGALRLQKILYILMDSYMQEAVHALALHLCQLLHRSMRYQSNCQDWKQHPQIS